MSSNLERFVKPSLIGQQSYFMNLCRQKRYNFLQTLNGITSRDPKFLAVMVMALGLIKEEFTKETEPAIQELIDGRFANVTDPEVALTLLVTAADGLIDTIYVCASFLNMFGFPGDEIWDIVQARNIAKAEDCSCNGFLHACPDCEGTGKVIVRRPDGKILKPDGWFPPEAEIKQLLRDKLNELRNAKQPAIPD